MEEVHKDRLRRLAKLLCKQAEKEHSSKRTVKFDLIHWGESRTKLTRSCGTTACAVGLACLTPEFQKEGLTSCGNNKRLIPMFNGQRSWDAVKSFFGISYEEAKELFSYMAYSTSVGPDAAMAISERITRFVETGKMYE